MCIRDREVEGIRPDVRVTNLSLLGVDWYIQRLQKAANTSCLLYTSDAADERSSVDLGGRRIIKKKNKHKATGRRSIHKYKKTHK